MALNKYGLPILKIQIRFEPDIVTARQKSRRLAVLLGFDGQDQARLATAVSELARNTFQYAGGGTAEFFFSEIEPQMFYIRFSDQGPGIRNLKEILDGNYVSPTGMGVGLSGSRKLVDVFEAHCPESGGTQIIIGKKLDARSGRVRVEDLQGITKQLLAKFAENPFEEIQNQNRDLLLAMEELRVREEQLFELNRELAETNRGVVALYAELDERARSLQRANEIKTSFLSHMTHEFRTPLGSIISLTRLLLQGIDGELSEEQIRQVTYIQKSGEGLLELVSDLLDLAKVEAGKVIVHPSEFDIEELLGGLRGMFRPILGPNSPLNFSVEWTGGLYMLNTDQGKVSQILRNLVSNAIKFTEKGDIIVSASIEDACVHFAVRDTGIGIDDKNTELIFEEFGQVVSKTQTGAKGTGLGLPLARKLARLLGGSMWVESQSGEGSTFHVLIPAVYVGERERVLIDSPENAANSVTAATAGAKFTVLIIDDDEPSRYVLRNLIEEELDVEIHEATNGRVGMQKLCEIMPDLIFLDLNMPQLDGFELLSAIKQEERLREIPIVVNTAKNLTDSEYEYLSRETTAILSKERSDGKAAIRDLRRALVKAGFDYRSM